MSVRDAYLRDLQARLAAMPLPMVEPPVADMSATLVGMPMTPHERAQRANAALTTEQRSAAGRARAAQLHHPVTLARRIAKAWPELSDEDRRAVRRELRAAGVIT